MTRAVYPATFDPITNGHVDIAERAARMFDELVVGVFDRPMKSLLFSIEERLAMTREALSHLDNIQVLSYSGLTVNFAKDQDDDHNGRERDGHFGHVANIKKAAAGYAAAWQYFLNVDQE